jgi:hypothetical protein
MQQTGPETNWSRSSVTPRQAAKELLRRTDAAESLIAFTEYTFPRYRTAEHHRIIAGQLERVERGEIDRLMLLVPPRHGKSELASIRLPAWFLGRQPHKQFLSVSATEGLASTSGARFGTRSTARVSGDIRHDACRGQPGQRQVAYLGRRDLLRARHWRLGSWSWRRLHPDR